MVKTIQNPASNIWDDRMKKPSKCVNNTSNRDETALKLKQTKIVLINSIMHRHANITIGNLQL